MGEPNLRPADGVSHPPLIREGVDVLSSADDPAMWGAEGMAFIRLRQCVRPN